MHCAAVKMPPPNSPVEAALAAAVLVILSLSLGGGHELDWNYQRRHAEANLEFHEFSATPGIMFRLLQNLQKTDDLY